MGSEKKASIQASRFQRDVLTFLKLAARHGGAHFTCNQMVMLGELWIAYAEQRPVCAADLRALCNMPKATVSRILASLGDEGLGFIVTQSDPEDGRRKLLLPSARLIRLNDKMSTEFRSYLDAGP